MSNLPPRWSHEYVALRWLNKKPLGMTCFCWDGDFNRVISVEPRLQHRKECANCCWWERKMSCWAIPCESLRGWGPRQNVKPGDSITAWFFCQLNNELHSINTSQPVFQAQSISSCNSNKFGLTQINIFCYSSLQNPIWVSVCHPWSSMPSKQSSCSLATQGT